MRVPARSSSRTRWWQSFALIGCATCLSGAYFRTCAGPTHGVYPQPCHPGGSECQPTPAKRSEALLAEAEATSVLVLQQWDRIEACFATPVSSLEPYETDASPHQACWIDTDRNGLPEPYASCHCYWNLDIPGVSVVGPWLREHVAQRATCDGGRSLLLQLGTVFPTERFPRTVPAYLKATPYDDPAMIQAFSRFWEQLAQVIADNVPDATRVEGGGLIVDPPEVIVSIGNEVDLYLDQPTSVLGQPVEVDGTAEQAWQRYAAFYEKAADWVRGRPVDLDGDGPDGATTSALGGTFPRSVTFSTTWKTCAPGWRVAHFLSGCGAGAPPLEGYLAMASRSDFWSFTRYVPSHGYDPEPADVYATARREAGAAFTEMGVTSVVGQLVGVTAVQRPLLIQELGFPSSQHTPGDNLLAEQQALYVAGAFDAWTEHNARWTALPEWWANVRLPPSEDWLDSPVSRPRALALNWFMLHDFSSPLEADPNNCQFWDEDAGAGAQVCSWGLYEADGTPKPAASAFLGRAQAVNPPERDPNRACEPY